MVVQAYNHPTIGRLRQKDHHEFEANQDYGVRHFLQVIIIIKRKSPILSNLTLAINLEQPLLRTWTIWQPLSNFKLSNAHFQLRLPQTPDIDRVPAPFSVSSQSPITHTPGSCVASISEASSFCFCLCLWLHCLDYQSLSLLTSANQIVTVTSLFFFPKQNRVLFANSVPSSI